MYLVPYPAWGQARLAKPAALEPMALEPISLDPIALEPPSQILTTEQLEQAEQSHPRRACCNAVCCRQGFYAGPSIMERSYRVSGQRRWSLGKGLSMVPRSLLRAFSPSPH